MSQDESEKTESKEHDTPIVFSNIKEALDKGVPKEAIISYWMQEFACANSLVREKMGELVELWLKYDVPQSVVLINLKILERLVTETMRNSAPGENKELFNQAMDEIEIMVDIITDTQSMEKGVKKVWDDIKEKSKPVFDPMCR